MNLDDGGYVRIMPDKGSRYIHGDKRPIAEIYMNMALVSTAPVWSLS